MGKRGNGWIQCLPAAVVVAVAVGLLTQSAAVAQGIRKGLETCAGVLIPSLFPFMVLSGLLSLTRLGTVISAPLAPVTERVLKLPKEMGATVLLGLIGGYPVGAKGIAALLSQKRISVATAQRMLCFCVNSGPSFLISAVGVGMFYQRSAGVILFATQTMATLLVGAAVSLRTPRPKGESNAVGGMKGAEAFVQAVTGAASAMLVMCAFAVLFSGLISLIEAVGVLQGIAEVTGADPGIVQAVVSGLLEVSTGCLNASALGGETAFAMVSAFVSFSGLSVLFQVMSCFEGHQVRFAPLFLARLCHMVLSTLMALPLYRRFCGERAVWQPCAIPIFAADRKSWIICACLLGMCTVLALSVKVPASFDNKCGLREKGKQGIIWK